MNRQGSAGERRWSVLALLATLLVMSGCSWESPTRKANLDAAVAEFDAASVGEILCEVEEGRPGPSSGYTTSIYFRGADTWLPMIERLEAIGYTLSGDPNLVANLRFDGSQGVSGAAIVAAPGAPPAEFVRALERNGCPPFPAEGLASVVFEERTR